MTRLPTVNLTGSPPVPHRFLFTGSQPPVPGSPPYGNRNRCDRFPRHRFPPGTSHHNITPPATIRNTP
jgi:hypothetical protein